MKHACAKLDAVMAKAWALLRKAGESVDRAMHAMGHLIDLGMPD